MNLLWAVKHQAGLYVLLLIKGNVHVLITYIKWDKMCHSGRISHRSSSVLWWFWHWMNTDEVHMCSNFNDILGWLIYVWATCLYTIQWTGLPCVSNFISPLVFRYLTWIQSETTPTVTHFNVHKYYIYVQYTWWCPHLIVVIGLCLLVTVRAIQATA